MNTTQIEKINRDRLTRWARHFNKAMATPQIMIGVGHKGDAKGQMVVTAVENIPNEQLIAILKGSIHFLENESQSSN